MLWITPIAECSIFNSMQPKFYEVMLATRQTAHLINLGLSINSLINCYHSRAWKIHQQVHGSPGNETPHHILQQCSADAYLPRDWPQEIYDAWRPHLALKSIFSSLVSCCFASVLFSFSWIPTQINHGSQGYQGKPCLNLCMVVTCPFIMVPLGGLRDQHLHCLPPCLICKSLTTDEISI